MGSCSEKDRNIENQIPEEGRIQREKKLKLKIRIVENDTIVNLNFDHEKTGNQLAREIQEQLDPIKVKSYALIFVLNDADLNMTQPLKT